MSDDAYVTSLGGAAALWSVGVLIFGALYIRIATAPDGGASERPHLVKSRRVLH
jgi:hypothetical protein